MRDINPQRLRYFYEVTVSGSIRGAAERLNTAPSVITRQIRLLEDELGAKLFERSIAGSVPTEAALEVLKYWKASRLQLEDLEQKISEIRNLSRGHVRIAVGEGFAPGLQQEVILPFTARHPNIHFTVEALGVADILEAVADSLQRSSISSGDLTCRSKRAATAPGQAAAPARGGGRAADGSQSIFLSSGASHDIVRYPKDPRSHRLFRRRANDRLYDHQ